MQILNHQQVERKVKRIAYQILENNFREEGIILAGINFRGMEFADLLLQELLDITEVPITVTRLHVHPPNPLEKEIHIEMPIEELKGKVVIVIDDVANTGRTIFYAMKPILEVLPKKVEVAVLVDRKHKTFPIQADYVGLSLATTMHDNIDVQILEGDQFAVYLE
ncbi:MAG: phosphoribosyltransferase family protein [Bacteroidota bacterium]